MNELEIWERIQEGDETAIGEIVKANLEGLWPIARSLAKTDGKWTPDDLYQEGALAMVRFASRWQYQKGVPFAAACRQRVRGAMKDFLRRKADTLRGAGEQPLSLDAGTEDGGRTLGEMLGDETSTSHEEETVEFSCLDRSMKKILEMRIHADQPKSVEEVASELGISIQRVRQLQRRAMNKIRLSA